MSGGDSRFDFWNLETTKEESPVYLCCFLPGHQAHNPMQPYNQSFTAEVNKTQDSFRDSWLARVYSWRGQSCLTPEMITLPTLGCGCSHTKRFLPSSSRGSAYVSQDCPAARILRSGLG